MPAMKSHQTEELQRRKRRLLETTSRNRKELSSEVSWTASKIRRERADCQQPGQPAIRPQSQHGFSRGCECQVCTMKFEGIAKDECPISAIAACRTQFSRRRITNGCGDPKKVYFRKRPNSAALSAECFRASSLREAPVETPEVATRCQDSAKARLW